MPAELTDTQLKTRPVSRAQYHDAAPIRLDTTDLPGAPVVLDRVVAAKRASRKTARPQRRRDIRQAARQETRSKRLRQIGRRCFFVAPSCVLILLLMSDTYSRNVHHTHSGDCRWVCRISYLLDWASEAVFHQTGTLVAILVIVAVLWWAVGLARDPWHWFRVFTPTVWCTGALLAVTALWPYQPGFLAGLSDLMGIVGGQAPHYVLEGTTVHPTRDVVTPVGDGFALSRVLLVLGACVALLGALGLLLQAVLYRTRQARARSVDIVIGNTPGTGELVRQLATRSSGRPDSLYGPGAHRFRWRKANLGSFPHGHPLAAVLPDIFSWRQPRTLIVHVHEHDKTPTSNHPRVVHLNLTQLHARGLDYLLASPPAARMIPGTGVCRLRHLYIFGAEQRINLAILADAKANLAELARRNDSGRLDSAHHGVPRLTVRLDNVAEASTFWLHEINQPYSPPRSAQTATFDDASPDAVPGAGHLGTNWMVDAASTDKAVAQAIVRQLVPGQHPPLIPGRDVQRLIIVGDSPLAYALLEELFFQRWRSHKLLASLVENHENIREFGSITEKHPRADRWVEVLRWLRSSATPSARDSRTLRTLCEETGSNPDIVTTSGCQSGPPVTYQTLNTHASPERGVWLNPPPIAHIRLVGAHAHQTRLAWQDRELAHLHSCVDLPVEVCECNDEHTERCLRADLSDTTSPTLVVMVDPGPAASRMASRLACVNPSNVAILEPDPNTRGVHPRLVPGGVGRFGPSWVVDRAPFAGNWERLAQQVHEHDLLCGYTSATMFDDPPPSAIRVTDRPWPNPYLPAGTAVLPAFFVADTIRCIHHMLHRTVKGPIRCNVMRDYLASGYEADDPRAHRLSVVLWQLAREEHADWLRARVRQGWVPQATNRYLRKLHAERGTEPTFDGYSNHRCDRTKINKWVRDWDEIVMSPFGPQFTDRTMRFAANLLTIARDTGVLSGALGHPHPSEENLVGRHS